MSNLYQRLSGLRYVCAGGAFAIFVANVYTYPESKMCENSKKHHKGTGERTVSIWLHAAAKGFFYAYPLLPLTMLNAVVTVATDHGEKDSFDWLTHLGQGYI
jgi:hypothetical protein